MPEVAEIWKEALPTVKQGVTGVGVWAALNAAKALTVEDGALILGLDHRDVELAGHLRLPQTRNLIESTVSRLMGESVTLRVIDGPGLEDWEIAKRRDIEARRLQEQALAKAKASIDSRSNWDTVYEQLGRVFAQTPNKSLPQNRARFYKEAIAIVAAARKGQAAKDDMTERNFARCIERVAQYSEVPSAVVAVHILQELGEIE